MVEDEAHLRAAAHQFRRVAELRVIDADVEAQVARREALHPGDERLAQAPARLPGMALDQVAHAPHPGSLRHRVEPGLGRVAPVERHADDHPGDQRVRCGDPGDELGLGELRVRGRVHLDEDRRLDLDPAQRRAEVGRQVRALRAAARRASRDSSGGRDRRRAGGRRRSGSRASLLPPWRCRQPVELAPPRTPGEAEADSCEQTANIANSAHDPHRRAGRGPRPTRAPQSRAAGGGAARRGRRRRAAPRHRRRRHRQDQHAGRTASPTWC